MNEFETTSTATLEKEGIETALSKMELSLDRTLLPHSEFWEISIGLAVDGILAPR